MTIADTATTEWIRRYHPSTGSAARLVVFPHAGGSASFYHAVSARFPDVDVVALQYPGRQDRHREPCIPTIAGMAEAVAAQLRQLTAKPTVFFGHSMGAVLAYETTRLLEADGPNAPRAIIASGRRGPATVRAEKVHLRDDDGILREIRELNGTDVRLLDDDFLRMAMVSIRNDYTAIETYQGEPDATVSCPITVFTGDADPKSTIDEAREWAKHTTAEFRLEVFAGGHFFIVPRAAEVNDAIERELKSL